MSEKILIIDGHSMLNRAFYGLPDLTNAEGRHTGAVLGFLNILFRVLDEEKPEYLVVAFDLSAPTFRHKMFAEYKGTRHPMPEELREQVPLIKEVLTAMGVTIITKEGYEADDLIGTVAKRGEKEGMDVTILSGDRDLLQLATDKILVRIPKTKGGQTTVLDYHTKDVIEEYQVTPAQIIELKALMGDTADNIPGLPGVGPKTATKILLDYGTIENAHDHVEELKPKKAMESMRDHWDLAVLSKQLATINTDSPVELEFSEARLGDLYTPEAYEIFRQLGFKKLLSRFGGQVTEDRKKLEVQIYRDFSEVDELFSRAKKEKQAGVYVLAGFDAQKQESYIHGVAVSFSAEDTAYVPMSGFVSGRYLKVSLMELAEAGLAIWTYGLKEQLRAVPYSRKTKISDVAIAAYLLDPLASDYPFDTLAAQYVKDVLILSAEEVLGTKKEVSWFEVPEETAAMYAGEIAYTALSCGPGLVEKLEAQGMRKLYDEVEMPLVYTLCHMEEAGIRVLPDELETYGENLKEGIARLETSIYEAAGEKFNINSPKQLGVILFEKMQLPGGKKTKTGYSTAADVLEKLAVDVPFVADILEYRQLTKLKSTYADGLAACIAADGRIHTTFKQTITATGRISSTEPNLQNIPTRIELGRQIRKCFVPQDGYVFVDADYSQIELRVLASLSGDEKLIEAYRDAEDIHAITASQVFHVPLAEVTPLMRRNAKAVNFGIVYGISAHGLSEDLNISRKEAQEYIDSYYEAYPGIRGYLESLVETAKKKEYSETYYGRRRPMPELSSGNFMQRQFGERVAKNAPIQGTAADIIKIAMNRVDQRLQEEGLKSRLLLQVHDELLLETAEDELERVREILREEMIGATDLAVSMEIDMHDGKNWYEAK